MVYPDTFGDLAWREFAILLRKLAPRVGLELTKISKPALTGTESLPQILPQATGRPSDLEEILTAWNSLAEPLKAAVLAIIRTAQGGHRE